MNSPPHFLLDALKESITSGTFIDTKFYLFSRRDPEGRVGAPRPLYCNSRVLNSVPYFSTLFSDGYLEGQMRDLDEGFPSDSVPFTESYEYSSDSDLEDECPCSGEDDEQPPNPQDSDSQVPAVLASETSPRQPWRDVEVERNHHGGKDSVRMGKVAIIRDMAAVTFESMVYFLYTGKITFAPFSSDPRHELPAEERVGDWSKARLPSPSAKSIYRLADKYDMPSLKEQARTHIFNSLAHCNIVDEVFSSLSLSFPEILSVQISRLASQMKEESKMGSESNTRRQLREKMTNLPQSQLARATDALAMIWDSVTGLVDLPALEPSKPATSMKLTPPLIWHWVIYPLSSNWNRVQVALLKSITTGTFVDVRFYAYSAIRDGSPADPKPLFTSSVFIGEWEPAITALAIGVESRDTGLIDGLTDDYECLHEELPGTLHKDKQTPKCQTEDTTTADLRGGDMVLVSGAWKTWMSLFSYAYTNEIAFGPLQTPTGHRDHVGDSKAELNESCSARSMYLLAAAALTDRKLGIESIKEGALKGIRSKLCASNIAQELFSSFAVNHEAVMDMEIEFYKNSTEHDPKLLMSHIQKTASSETPLLPTTLSLIYDKLVEKVFAQPPVEGSNPVSGSGVPLPPDPVWLECFQCGERARLQDLHNGLRCPRCPPRTLGRGRPFMQCPSCDLVRGTPKDSCVRTACQAKFV